jgi:hypothetical protein
MLSIPTLSEFPSIIGIDDGFCPKMHICILNNWLFKKKNILNNCSSYSIPHCTRYRERIVWTDKALNLKLLRKGILTRIYAPMVCFTAQIFHPKLSFSSPIFELQRSLFGVDLNEHIPDAFLIFCSQVIVQRLRETGVFTSVIASAQKVLSSVTNSSTAGVASSSKIGHDGESKATARRVLQIPDNASFSSAIPPLSPPGLEGLYMEM